MLRMDPGKRATCKEVVQRLHEIYDKALVDSTYCLRPVSTRLKRMISNLSMVESDGFKELAPDSTGMAVENIVDYQGSQSKPPHTSDSPYVPWRAPEQRLLHSNSPGKLSKRLHPSQLISKRVHFDLDSTPTSHIDGAFANGHNRRDTSPDRQNDTAGRSHSVSILSTSNLKNFNDSSGEDKLNSQTTLRKKLRRLWPRRKD